MGLIIERDKGWAEAILDSNCEYAKFYSAADIMQKDLGIKFINQLNDFDSLYWDFDFQGSLLTLHYNIYVGVVIFPRAFKSATEKDNDNVLKIAGFVFNRI